MDEGTAVPITHKPAPPRLMVRRISPVSLMFDPRNWPVWIVVLMCAAVFVGQFRGLVPLETYAFSIAAWREGRWWTPLSAMFMHGDGVNPLISLVHIGMNMWAYLSLAPLVAARFGRGWRGLVPFHVFYLLAGLSGTAVFGFLHPDSRLPLVGASGAIYGVYAAVMRLDLLSERLEPLFSRRTLRAVWFFIWSNALVVGLFVASVGGLDALHALVTGRWEGLYIPIAWEAHLGGFVSGFVLVGVMKGRNWDRGWKAGIEIAPGL